MVSCLAKDAGCVAVCLRGSALIDALRGRPRWSIKLEFGVYAMSDLFLFKLEQSRAG